MTCEHWKRCGDCHSPGLVTGLRKVEEDLRARVVELEAAIHGALRSRDRREPVDFEALEAALSPSSPSGTATNSNTKGKDE